MKTNQLKYAFPFAIPILLVCAKLATTSPYAAITVLLATTACVLQMNYLKLRKTFNKSESKVNLSELKQRVDYLCSLEVPSLGALKQVSTKVSWVDQLSSSYLKHKSILEMTKRMNRIKAKPFTWKKHY